MKQPQLNGAYYGPAIPPQRSYRSVGRSSGCGPCCLLCNLFKFLISIIIIIGIIILVLWLLLRPNAFKVHATSASLKAFDVTNGSLQYDLNVNMSIRNPNKRIGIYYDYIETQAYYDGSRFGFDNSFEPFYQGHKNTSYIDTSFNGKNALVGDSFNSTYNKEKSDGYYNVELKFRPKLRLKIWIFKIKHIKPKVTCDLKLPVPGTSGTFSEKKCDVDYF
jgi:Late embryogenesis abundant protein